MTCPRCENDFDADVSCARVLPCGHVFCSTCLKGLQQHQPSSPSAPSPITTFTCPCDSVQVRVPSSCPEDAIRALPREREIIKMFEAARINPPQARQCEVCEDDAHTATHRCVNCDQGFCSAMAKAHKKMRGFASHTVVEEIGESSALGDVSESHCWHHHQPMVAYDTLCDRAVCVACMCGTHLSHTVITLEEAAELSRQALPGDIAAAEDLMRRLTACVEGHSDVKVALGESLDATKELIRATINAVRHV